MFRHIVKTALRGLARQKLFTSINVVGLAVGLSGCLLIFGFVRNELSFENCHDNADRIYRVAFLYETGGSTLPGACAMPPLAPALIEECPEVETAVRFQVFTEAKVRVGDEIYRDNVIAAASPEILDVFTLPLVEGNPATALNDPYSVLLTQSAANRFFGDELAVGKTVNVMNRVDCRVVGILRDPPPNTQVRSDMIASYSTLKEVGIDTEDWEQIGEDYTYLLLKEGADYKSLEEKIPLVVGRHLEEEQAQRFTFFLQPLKDIYLHSSLSWELQPTGNLDHIWLLSIVATLILVIACANFINLTTARVAHRTKEVGMRKVVGASRPQLIRQFLGETILLACTATVLSLAFYEIERPTLEAFLERQLHVSLWTDPMFAAAALGLVLLIGAIAGSYPALFMSGLKPIENLRQSAFLRSPRSKLRRVLVVFQFSIAIALICMTVAIRQQTNYFKTVDKGFDEENIIVLKLDEELPADRAIRLRDRIIQSGKVVSATAMGHAPGVWTLSLTFIKPEGHTDEDAQIMQLINADHNYLSLFGIDILAGENVQPAASVSETRNVLLTSHGAEEFGLDDPVGCHLYGQSSEYKVIGIMDDFRPYPLEQGTLPIALWPEPDEFEQVAVKLHEAGIAGQLETIRAIWEEVVPEYALFLAFSLLAMSIACLGIFALSCFAAERRTKEIGIRKALGASVTIIVRLISSEFLALVAIANVVAWPIAFYAINLWLSDFAYHMDIGWEIFAIGMLLSLAIAVLTVSVQSLRAARSNPVKALRYE
jgi:putative ABC transport system permease protein